MFSNYQQPYPYQQRFGAQNYMPNGYVPQMPQSQPQTQMQQPMQMQIPQMQTDLPIQDIKFVNKAQAEAYIVFPNTKVMLIDTDMGFAYIKTADGMGQCKTDYFKFEKVNADGTPLSPQEAAPQVNLNEFIKKEDLSNLGFVTVEQYEELRQQMEKIKKYLEGVKQNGGQQK